LIGLLGSIGAGSLVWAMCAVFVAHDPTQTVAAVGSLAISGIAGVSLFVVRVSRAGVDPTKVIVVSPRAPFASVELDRGFVHAHIAVGTSPPKLAIFTEG
jgi:choline-glycine betaine transporter